MVKKVKLVCAQCGVVFERDAKEVRRQIRMKGSPKWFCSLSCSAVCHNAPRKMKHFLHLTCARCGKTFSCLSNAQRKYCGASCASLGSVTPFRRRRAREIGILNCTNNKLDIAAGLRSREAKKNALVREYLDIVGVSYVFEKRIGKFIYDLFLPEQSLCVEFDSPYHRYWRQVAIDKDKDKVAVDAGYRILRIPVKASEIIPPDGLFHLFNA